MTQRSLLRSRRLPVTLVALAFLGVAMPLLPSAAAAPCSTGLIVANYTSCTFSCGKGQNVQVRGSGYGILNAQCGGGSCGTGPTAKLNPTCSFFASYTDSSGQCWWSGTGSANCHN